MSVVKDLILIRHAPADHGGALCGRRDVAVATLDGAGALGAYLPDLPIVTSPALRCRQTAQAIWPGRTIAQDARLWEQDFGAEDGVRFDQLPDLGPMDMNTLAARVPAQGESFVQMCDRVQPALRALAPAIIIAHAGTVRAGLACALGNVGPALSFEVAPLSVTHLRVSDHGWSIRRTNWMPR